MDVFRLVATVLVMAGVVVAILLFEKRRAEGIRRDTGLMARGPGAGDRPRRPGAGEEPPADSRNGGTPDSGSGDNDPRCSPP